MQRQRSNERTNERRGRGRRGSYTRGGVYPYIHRVNYFRRSVHRVNAISRHDWLAGRSVGWLADWLKPATPLQTRTNEPRDCPERNWSTGTGVVLPRSWTWTTTWVHLDSWRDTPTHAARKVLHYKVQDTPQSVDPSLSPCPLPYPFLYNGRLAFSFATPSSSSSSSSFCNSPRLLLGFFKDPLCWKLG